MLKTGNFYFILDHALMLNTVLVKRLQWEKNHKTQQIEKIHKYKFVGPITR